MGHENKSLPNQDQFPVNVEKQPGQQLYTADPYVYDRIDTYIDRIWQKVKTQERTLDSFFTYRNSLKQFYEFAKERGFPEPTPGFITRFKEHLVGRGIKAGQRERLSGWFADLLSVLFRARGDLLFSEEFLLMQ